MHTMIEPYRIRMLYMIDGQLSYVVESSLSCYEELVPFFHCLFQSNFLLFLSTVI